MDGLKEIIEILKQNSLPKWLNIVGICVPIFLSIAVIIVTVVNEKQNKKLRKNLHSKDVKIQFHNDILEIYNLYCAALNTFTTAQDSFLLIVAYPNYTIDWNNTLHTSIAGICGACNHANLILGKENELSTCLKKIYNKSIEIQKEFLKLMNSQIINSIRLAAWQTVSNNFNIQFMNYEQLSIDTTATEKYLELCNTEIIQTFSAEAKSLCGMFQDEQFDRLFEPYVKLSELESVDK